MPWASWPGSGCCLASHTVAWSRWPARGTPGRRPTDRLRRRQADGTPPWAPPTFWPAGSRLRRRSVRSGHNVAPTPCRPACSSMPPGLATAPEPKEGAMDLNVVAITGRLAADPELHSTGNGTDVTTLRIAVGRMKRQGEQRPGADFVDVVVWGEQAKHAGRYLAKGRRVAIKGRLQQRTWTTPDGANRSRLQVVADQVQFLDYKDRTGDDTGQVPDEPEPETAPEPAAGEAPSPGSVEPAPEAPADAPAEDATPGESAEAPPPPAADSPRRTPRRKKA